ncbi:hypothetical protein HWI79_1499 [Cryptosporidium felis]|nr:hypothetical protein HWI79_1499 [Cryptosporidium felis]
MPSELNNGGSNYLNQQNADATFKCTTLSPKQDGISSIPFISGKSAFPPQAVSNQSRDFQTCSSPAQNLHEPSNQLPSTEKFLHPPSTSLFHSTPNYISSDNLKDAVRRWHAKRKKDPSSKSDIQETSVEKKFDANKYEKDKNSTIDCTDKIGMVQSQNYTQDPKRLRDTELESIINGPFDGPMSFDAIMAMKKKKPNTCNSQENTLESTVLFDLRSSQSLNANSTETNLRNPRKSSPDNIIESIRLKAINSIRNFGKHDTLSELTAFLDLVLNDFSSSIEKQVLKLCNQDSGSNGMEKSLDLCIGVISQRSNSSRDEFDEIALECLAKYPLIFESLKTLTNIEDITETTPENICEYLNKFTKQMEKINNAFNNTKS